MKKKILRWLSGILSAVLIFGCILFTPAAAVTTADGHVLTQPELLAQFTFPEDWSKNALEFCVGNGILKGRDGGLAPKANTTRAETAAMLVRLLGATGDSAALAGFKDVSASDWYYSELAAAVDIGVMKGVSETEIAPNAPITREQVFALLSRAFGIYPTDPDRWSAFADGQSIAVYARDAVSALAERGYLTGYTDGTVAPKAYITRAELAKLLYELFTCIVDAPDQLPASGRVLYRGTEPIPEGYALSGNLTIGCGYEGSFDLSGLQVSGMLVLRPMPDSEISLSGCSMDILSVPAKAVLVCDSRVGKLLTSGSGSVLHLSADTVWAYESCTLMGDYDTVNCQTDGITVTLNGTADSCQLMGLGIVLNGSGHAGTVDVYRNYCKVNVSSGSVNDKTWVYEYNTALSTVETVIIWDTVIQDTWLYSNSKLTKKLRRLPAGTKLDHFYVDDGSTVAQVYTEDGVFGYVPLSDIRIPKTMDLRSQPYSEATMEGFVNQKGYSSSSKYLLWVSLKTQTVNIFTGKKGQWQLLKSCPCATGKPKTPTCRGVFSVYQKVYEWDFGATKARYVTKFYRGYAFHSRLYVPSYAYLADATIGKPASHGCLRMYDEDCKYIYDNVPRGTTVVVY